MCLGQAESLLTVRMIVACAGWSCMRVYVDERTKTESEEEYGEGRSARILTRIKQVVCECGVRLFVKAGQVEARAAPLFQGTHAQQLLHSQSASAAVATQLPSPGTSAVPRQVGGARHTHQQRHSSHRHRTRRHRRHGRRLLDGTAALLCTRAARRGHIPLPDGGHVRVHCTPAGGWPEKRGEVRQEAVLSRRGDAGGRLPSGHRLSEAVPLLLHAGCATATAGRGLSTWIVLSQPLGTPYPSAPCHKQTHSRDPTHPPRAPMRSGTSPAPA